MSKSAAPQPSRSVSWWLPQEGEDQFAASYRQRFSQTLKDKAEAYALQDRRFLTLTNFTPDDPALVNRWKARKARTL